MSDTIDLSSMDLKELNSLKRKVSKEIDNFEKKRKSDALTAAREAAKEHGFDLQSLIGTPAKRAKRQSLGPRYANPKDPEQTWTGMGRRPHWIKDALEQGRRLEEFEI